MSMKIVKTHVVKAILTREHNKLLLIFDEGERRLVDIEKWLKASTGKFNPRLMQHFEVDDGDLIFLNNRRISGPTLYHMGMPQ